MNLKKIYQTLDDRDNADYIEANGPFRCERNDAWIGKGFYFWEDNIEWAHKWGKKCYGNRYVICQSSYDLDVKNYLDLADAKCNEEIFSLKEKLQKRRNTKDVKLAHIIAYLQESKDFKCDAIRLVFQKIDDTIEVSQQYNAYLPRIISIQICVLKKSFLIDRFEIIHPSEYIAGCLV